jgi:dTMP kinase
MATIARGRFIVFEGIDGSGKSTQVRLLSKRLKLGSVRVYETMEPTDSPIGSLIHQIMSGRVRSDHKTIAALFVADRLDHLQNEINGILSKIEQGISVLADRYYFSSYAYHGVHMHMDWVIQANALSAQLLRPDVTIFIDVEPDLCIERLRDDRSRLELYENVGNMRKVREQYFEAFKQLAKEERVVIVDGNQSEERVAADVWQAASSLFQP